MGAAVCFSQRASCSPLPSLFEGGGRGREKGHEKEKEKDKDKEREKDKDKESSMRKEHLADLLSSVTFSKSKSGLLDAKPPEPPAAAESREPQGGTQLIEVCPGPCRGADSIGV